MKKFKEFMHVGDLVFFSAKGESMSDAQSMKGKCTQISEDVRANIDALGPVKKVVHFDGKDIDFVTPLNTKATDIKKLIGKDAEANALNGWYGNAIQMKNILLDKIRDANWTLFLKGREAFIPDEYNKSFDLEKPILNVYNENDIKAEWSANEISDFLIKEQYCATVGKLIHKKGKLHDLYNTPLTKTGEFVELKNGGNGNTGTKEYPVQITPTYEGTELKKVKELYLETHDSHREIEKKVNWYKAKIKNEVTAKNAEGQRIYAGELDVYNKAKNAYNDIKNAALDEIRGKNAKLTAVCEERRQLMIKDAASLKIFIPENLRAIKKYVQKYKIL